MRNPSALVITNAILNREKGVAIKRNGSGVVERILSRRNHIMCIFTFNSHFDRVHRHRVYWNTSFQPCRTLVGVCVCVARVLWVLSRFIFYHRNAFDGFLMSSLTDVKCVCEESEHSRITDSMTKSPSTVGNLWWTRISAQAHTFTICWQLTKDWLIVYCRLCMGMRRINTYSWSASIELFHQNIIYTYSIFVAR